VKVLDRERPNFRRGAVFGRRGEGRGEAGRVLAVRCGQTLR
jgi:hypothetical protein